MRNTHINHFGIGLVSIKLNYLLLFGINGFIQSIDDFEKLWVYNLVYNKLWFIVSNALLKSEKKLM